MNIIFTGGTHVGKTTILDLFGTDKKYKIFGEKAGENMIFLRNLLGDIHYREWRIQNFLEFQTMNIIGTLKRDLTLNNNHINLLDRGVFDFIASLKREKIQIPDYLLDLLNNINYDLIFYFEPIQEHKTRKETGRMLDKNKSELWAKFIIREYLENFGKNKVVKVPYFETGNLENNILERYKFVKEIIENYYAKNT